jgi:hypothetical protein
VALAGEYEFSDPEIANRLLVELGKGELASYYRPIPPARWLVIGIV